MCKYLYLRVNENMLYKWGGGEAVPIDISLLFSLYFDGKIKKITYCFTRVVFLRARCELVYVSRLGKRPWVEWRWERRNIIIISCCFLPEVERNRGFTYILCLKHQIQPRERTARCFLMSGRVLIT